MDKREVEGTCVSGGVCVSERGREREYAKRVCVSEREILRRLQ